MEKQNGRSGNDRRVHQVETSPEKRNSPERRNIVKDYEHNIKIMKKSQYFMDLQMMIT